MNHLYATETIPLLSDNSSALRQVLAQRVEELAQEKQRLANILWGTGVGTWEWNVQTGETRFNERWAELIGYTLDELAPISIATWMKHAHPEDIVISGAALEKHFAGETDAYECEARMLHRQGHWIWVLDRGKLVSRTPDGQPEWMAGTHWEISARKQAEEEILRRGHLLKESESRFRAMADSAPVLIWVAGPDKQWNYFNKVWLEFTGRSIEQEMGNGWAEGVHPQDFQRCLDTYVRAFDARQECVMEYRLRRFDGEYRWLLNHGVPRYDDQGTFAGYIGSCIDITERKQIEQALRRSNAELEQFAYVASHDLRQPLRMVNGYVQMLERRLAEKLDAETREMMHFVTDGAKRMDQMLVSLLDYSRVGRKGEPLALMNSRDAVDEALHFLEPAMHEAQATVKVSGDWPHVMVSRNEFTRLWQNLIGNALKYRAVDRPPHIDVTVTPEEQGWHFCVADNGIGIDPAQFERLFKVFQRLHPRDQYEGYGIGLAVARKIVERHGGRIWVESDGAGSGCRFCFTLPTQPTENAA